MSLRRPEFQAPLRQVLVRGRAVETVTDRPLAVEQVATQLDEGAGFAPFETQWKASPGGWFTVHLDASREWPDSFAAAQATLRVTVHVNGTASTHDLAFDTADRGLINDRLTVRGTDLDVTQVAGDPFELTVTRDPAPVSLHGTVLEDDDPTQPVTGATVTAAGGPSTVTDALGQYRLAPLPLVASLDITASKDGASVSVPHHITYGPVFNRLSLSLSFSPGGQ